MLPKVRAMSAFLNQIEMGPKPVIAAINGNALGRVFTSQWPAITG